MDANKLRINGQLETMAKAWQDGRGKLLSGAQLWHAGRYSRTASYKAAELSDLAQQFVAESMRINADDFYGTTQLEDRCRGCRYDCSSGSLKICLECSIERCVACCFDFERNEHGDSICPFCGGIMA